MLIEMDTQIRTELILDEKKGIHKIYKYIFDPDRLSFLAKFKEKSTKVKVDQF